MKSRTAGFLVSITLLAGLSSCSVYKYVPQDKLLLDKVEVVSSDRQFNNPSGLAQYSYQQPNSKWLGLFRFPLRLYSLSGTRNPDSGINRFLRNLGEQPVVFDDILTEASRADMQLALANDGYLNADVTYEVHQIGNRKAEVSYKLNPGRLYVVDDIRSVINDEDFKALLLDNSKGSLLRKGMNLNSSVLNEERGRIVELARRNGYYALNKEHISFVADTVEGSGLVGLEMVVADDGIRRKYRLSDINYILSPDAGKISSVLADGDKLDCVGYSVYFPGTDSIPVIRPEIIGSHSYLRKGQVYNSDSIAETYTSLSRLGLLRYSNINLVPDAEEDGGLTANVSMVIHPKHSFGFEVEGTNTAGDLGAAASMSYTDRNLFRGSEQLTLKLRGAYESISNLPGYTGNTYLEYGFEANLDFPEFLVPFMNQELQRKSQAISQFSLKVNSQQRPEFQKAIFSAGWSYVWGDTWRQSNRLDVLDINYLVVPWISSHFQSEYLDQITSGKSILKYNYENLLITKLGYTYYRTNARPGSVSPFQYTIRTGFETSGNMFSLTSNLLGLKKNDDGQSMVMGIAFAQYAKHDFSFTANWHSDIWGNLLCHLEWGVAVPYGNSTSLPFEKRYFAGGANGVRGWAVRELGPGIFGGEDRAIDYIRQSGDIKLGSSIEYRSKLFWKLNGAAFVDAGNIWTIRDYEEQPGGLFRFDEFYKQIAVSYGVGLRLDLNFLVVRLDGGMKAFNPAGRSDYDRKPLLHPDFGRDFALHLAVGYPF